MTKSITITSDDEMYNDVVALLFGNQADVDTALPSSPEKDADDSDSGSDEALSWADLEKGMTVLVDFGEDGEVECEITSMPKKNKKQVQVTPQDTGEPEMIDIEDILEISEGDGEDEGAFAEGDEVEFKKGRKKLQGTIKTLLDDDTAKIKIPAERKLEIVELEKLAIVEEE